ncbi:arginase family protein [Herbiconiux sp. VKM Ac-2851]|uniref:arginase family protein n=1 Tax=Herbiconiux sp. VKM Ac-2851 TaxID=2739025 RepID=UPI00352F5526
MSATFVVVPSWQGSGSSRAMRLIDGAEAVRGDLPAAATRVVEVPQGAGESLDTGVHRFSSIAAIAQATEAVLADAPGTPILVGGDCGVEFAGIRHAASVARRSPDARLAVVWFDAHADLNTPQSSPSGAFHGMVLRALLGGGPAELSDPSGTGAVAPVLEPAQVVLAGARALDDAEAEYVAEAGIRMLGPTELADPAALVETLVASGATEVYLHVDLDVIDPGEIEGVQFPEPFGLPVAELVTAIRAVRERFPLTGAGITEFAPSTPEAAVDDLPAILRIVSALVR